MNEGAKLLAQVIDQKGPRGGQERVRAELDCAQGVVGRWATAERKPDIPNRGKLLERYGIPFESWDVEIPEPEASPAPQATGTDSS